MLIEWRRVLGTFGNPNYWGLAICTMLVIFAYNVFWQGKVLHLPILLILFWSLLLTGSRTALIGFIGAVLIGAIILWRSVNEKPKLVGIAAVASIVVALVVWVSVGEFYENKNRFTTHDVVSLEGRLVIWEETWNSASGNIFAIIFGQGSWKAEHILNFGDNSYLFIWRSYGIFGLSLYVGLLTIMYRKTLALIREVKQEEKDSRSIAWLHSLLLILLLWVIFEFAADAWFYVPSAAGLLGIYTFVHTVTNTRKNNRLILKYPARPMVIPPKNEALKSRIFS